MDVRSTMTVLVTTTLIVTLSTAATPAAANPPDAAPAAKPVPPTADALTTPAYALPAWGDGQWGSSENYDTIQTADLDGDGSDELFGRSGTGVEFWDFDTTAGQWRPMATTGFPVWSDAGDWNKREYYETIHAADLDGDGTDEVFARGGGGIESWKLSGSGSSATWSALPLIPEFASWAAASEYETIQAADLDGDGAAEVFGRGPDGLMIASLDGGAWTITQTSFYGDEWAGSQYAQTMQAGDIDGDGKAEVIVRGADGMTAVGLVDGTWTVMADTGPFTDAQKWDKPEYYLAIGTADFDGDGTIEVYGRGAGAVEVYEFADGTGRADAGTWTQASSLAEFTDAQDWSRQDQYLTLQTGDVDGDGRDELLGRGADGMTVWGYNGASRTWTNEQDVAGPAFTNKLGWDKPWYYQTIQTADVDGVAPTGSPGSANNARAELLGRGPTGMQTYRFDATAGAWVSPSATYPTWSGTAAKAYAALSSELASTTDDIRSQYTVAGPSQLNTWAENSLTEPRPKNIPRKTWDAVRDQVHSELQWAYQVASMAENSSQLIGAISDFEKDDTTADHLDYDVTSADSSVIASAIEYVAGLLDGLSNLGEPELQVAAGLVDAFASYAFSVGQDLSSDYNGSYEDLQKEQMAAWWGGAQNATATARVAIAGDYGLLSTVGDLYESATWEQVAPGSMEYKNLTLAAARAYSVWMWQVVTLDLGEPCKFGWNCNEWGASTCESGKTCLYTVGDRAYELAVVGCELFDPDLACNHRVHAVPDDLAQQLIETTSDHCLTVTWDASTCGFGVPGKDVILGLNGWTYDCTWQTTEDACTYRSDVSEEYGNRYPWPEGYPGG